jgi:hypothetical protein
MSKIDTELLYAYLAGAVDADGFITVYRKAGPIRKDGHRPIYYVAKIGLSETNPIIPELLYKTFGSWLGEYQPKNPHHKKWYVWQATNDKARNAIQALLPYLRLKKRQAELALEFINLVKKQKANGQVLTKEQEAERFILWKSVGVLNEPRNRRIHFLPDTNGTKSEAK